MKRLLVFFPLMTVLAAEAMPTKTQLLRPRFATEQDVSVDLKSKTLLLGQAEFEACGQNLVRKANSLTFVCTLPIPNNTRVSKLKSLLSAKTKEVEFGGTKRTVLTEVSEDARKITFSTAFDHTGIDFELSKFNDDFFAVYAKVAQIIISDALKNSPVRIEVLESR